MTCASQLKVLVHAPLNLVQEIWNADAILLSLSVICFTSMTMTLISWTTHFTISIKTYLIDI